MTNKWIRCEDCGFTVSTQHMLVSVDSKCPCCGLSCVFEFTELPEEECAWLDAEAAERELLEQEEFDFWFYNKFIPMFAPFITGALTAAVLALIFFYVE